MAVVVVRKKIQAPKQKLPPLLGLSGELRNKICRSVLIRKGAIYFKSKASQACHKSGNG